MDALKSLIAARYPQSTVVGLWDRRLSSGTVTEVWLNGAEGITRRLVHPQTGEDLGAAQPPLLRTLEFMHRAHVAVLSGTAGRLVNAAGALVLMVLSISGIAVRRIRFQGRAAWQMKRRAHSWHRAAGVSVGVLGVIWGVTGACFAFPSAVAGVFDAEEPAWHWLYALHTGTAGGTLTRIVWTLSALGLASVAITGALMAYKKIGWRRRDAVTAAVVP